MTWGFTQELLCFPKNGLLKVTVTECHSLLTLELCHPGGYLWIPDAIRKGLLKLLLTETHRSTVYYSVLREMERCLPEVIRRRPLFLNAPEVPQWAAFVALAKDRLELKKNCDSVFRAARSRGNLNSRPALLVVRCITATPRANALIGHTTVHCAAIHLSDPLTARNKSFMRTLIQQTHHRNLGTILQMQARYTASSGRSDFLIVHDYKNGIPDLAVASVISYERGTHPDLDIQQTAYGRRAVWDPRIVLSIVRFPGHPLRILPMRSLDTRVHE
ncbi:hypothetical protein DFH06DRAFT_1333670 [Mycena polygramma]|nr:hypothetical protein DFH06DRAFT_1333670 [Mycena polygramma]